MLLKRHIKQIQYGFLYLIVALFVVVGGFFLFIRQPAPPVATPTPTSEFDPIAVEDVHVITHGTTADVVARLRNPNPRAGIPKYTVTFILLGANNQTLTSYPVDTYLLPGAVSYVAAFNLAAPSAIAGVRLKVPDQPQFDRIPLNVTLPSFSTFLRERSKQAVFNQTFEQQKGIVQNTSTLPWQTVQVTGVALDASGNVVGVGSTFVGELKPGEEREFTLQWPIPLAPTTQVIVLPTTNLFKEADIIKVIGDPSLLR